MTTAGSAKRKIWAVMEGGSGNLCGENETMLDIYRSILLKPEVGNIILDRPVGFKIAGEF
jgi:hypothetical protein